VATLRGKLRCRQLRFVPFADSLPEAIRQVRAAACDMIYYWEVGSDAGWPWAVARPGLPQIRTWTH
jgi:hypothetical protein